MGIGVKAVLGIVAMLLTVISAGCESVASDGAKSDVARESAIISASKDSIVSPLIRDIEERVVRGKSAVILWHTDRPASGQVEYGLSRDFGAVVVAEDSDYFHALKLTALKPLTLYYYRVTATDGEGAKNISDVRTFTTLSEPIAESVAGVAPNAAGDTVVDRDTTWRGMNVHCGGGIKVGNAARGVNFTIEDSTITVKGKVAMGGDMPVNFALRNSTIIFDVTNGASAFWPRYKGAVIDATRKIEILTKTDEGQSSSVELKDSVIRGPDILHRGVGVRIVSRVIIIDNVKFEHLGGLMEGGHGAFALVATGGPGSYLKNITINECGFGLVLSKGIPLDHATSHGGMAAFFTGSDLQHLAMHKTVEGLYAPTDGAWVRNGWFDANETKFNIMSASDVLFEKNTVFNAAFNGGDGSRQTEGNNNIIRDNTFIKTGVGGRKKGLKVLNNTFYRGMPTGGDVPIRTTGVDSVIANNIIVEGGTAIMVDPHPILGGPGKNHLISGNIINNSAAGIYVGKQENNLFVNNKILKTRLHGILLKNSSRQLFVDNSISNTGTHDISFGGGNSDIKFINTKFDGAKVHFKNDTDVFNNYYYLDVLVVDGGGKPVSGSAVNIKNDTDDHYPSINIKGKAKTSFVTGANGHTLVPVDNESNSIAIPAYRQTQTGRKNMTYTIAASKSGQTASMGQFTIDADWYRQTPNTPVKTVVLNLGTGKGSVRTNPTGVITGKITDSRTGKPLAMATVTDGVRFGTTDAEGAYSMVFPAGAHTITASKKDFAVESKKVDVTDGGQTSADFQLGS